MNTAVRLHNKVRNFVPGAHSELKAITKATASWMLLLFSSPVPKALCAIIKLLARSVQEMQSYSNKVVFYCCNTAIELWNKLSLESLTRSLPSIELQDMKIAVYNVYLSNADIMVTESVYQNISGARTSILSAMELVQSLPDGLKVHFVEQAVILGTRLSLSNSMSDASYFLQIAVSNIDLLCRAKYTVSNSNEDISINYDGLLMLKVRALLSLAYVFKEME